MKLPSRLQPNYLFPLSISEEQGVNWIQNISIFSSHAAYSDLVALDNGSILVLYEAGDETAYEGIHYKIISKSLIATQALL